MSWEVEDRRRGAAASPVQGQLRLDINGGLSQ